MCPCESRGSGQVRPLRPVLCLGQQGLTPLSPLPRLQGGGSKGTAVPPPPPWAPAGKVLRPQLGEGTPSVLPHSSGGAEPGSHTPLPPAGWRTRISKYFLRSLSLLFPAPPQGLRNTGQERPRERDGERDHSSLATEMKRVSPARGLIPATPDIGSGPLVHGAPGNLFL